MCNNHQWSDWDNVPGVSRLYSRICNVCAKQQVLDIKQIYEQEKDALIKQYKAFSTIAFLVAVILFFL